MLDIPTLQVLVTENAEMLKVNCIINMIKH